MGLLAAISVVLALSYLSFGGALLAMTDMRAVAHQRVDRYSTLAARFAARYLENQAAAWEAQRWTGSASPVFAPTPMAATSMCAAGVTCGVTAAATYVSDGAGDTFDGTNPVVAPNVEQNARELRLAFTVHVTVANTAGEAIVARDVRVKARVFGTSGAEVIEVQDTGSRGTRVLAGAAENEGCAPGGSGCDADRVGTADPTTIDAVYACSNGFGSGTCPANGVLPNEAKASVTWSNAQAGAATGGP